MKFRATFFACILISTFSYASTKGPNPWEALGEGNKSVVRQPKTQKTNSQNTEVIDLTAAQQSGNSLRTSFSSDNNEGSFFSDLVGVQRQSTESNSSKNSGSSHSSGYETVNFDHLNSKSSDGGASESKDWSCFQYLSACLGCCCKDNDPESYKNFDNISQ